VRIAVISDVHANAWALEAVLRDIRGRGVDRVINLGDSLHGPLAPEETAALLRDPMILSVMGDSDRLLVADAQGAQPDITAAFVRSAIEDPTMQWLRSLLPAEVFGKDVLACHGCPDSDESLLLEQVTESGVSLRSPRELLRRLRSVKQRLVLCGHSHIFRTTVLAKGTTIVNPGSVGLPAYRAVKPYPHVMSSGSPAARYALVASRGTGFDVQPVQIDYDWETAAAVAFANGRPDCAVWLRTGRA